MCIYTHDEPGAVSTVCQACTTPYIGISNKLYCIVDNFLSSSAGRNAGLAACISGISIAGLIIVRLTVCAAVVIRLAASAAIVTGFAASTVITGRTTAGLALLFCTFFLSCFLCCCLLSCFFRCRFSGRFLFCRYNLLNLFVIRSDRLIQSCCLCLCLCNLTFIVIRCCLFLT